MELKEAIYSRRTIRKFTDFVVTDDEISELMEAARFAPSWANTQTWEFIIVRDNKLITEITETYSKKNPARACSFNASVIIIAVSKLHISGCRNKKNRTIFNEWNMYDMGMAMQNISLMAHELGLGTVIVGSMDHKQCKKLLNVPDEYEVVCAMPVGKPAEEKIAPRRKEQKEFVHIDFFGEKK